MRKKIVLELDEETAMVYGVDDWYVGCLMKDLNGRADVSTTYGYAGEPQVIEKEVEKIVYKEPEIHEESRVYDLIQLKESGFTVEDILELSDKRLI